LGIVQTAKKILSSNLFGDLNNLIIEFGDVHYNYDNFRSDKSKAGVESEAPKSTLTPP